MERVIRRLTKADVPEFWRLRLEGLQRFPAAFGSSYEDAVRLTPEEGGQRLSVAGDNFVVGAFEEDTLVGMVGFRRETGAKSAHKGLVWGMYVCTETQGGGVGRRLLEYLLAEARKLDGMEQAMLMVEADNTPAVRLYTRVGFTIYGTEPHALYVDGRYYDEHLMVYPFR